MNQSRQRFLAAIAATGMLALPAIGWAQEAKAKVLILRQDQPETTQRRTLYLVDQEAADDDGESSDRWIGVQVTELPPVLRKHLRLKHGVLAEDVMPDTPAAKAGIEQHDVLLSIEGKVIELPEDVRDAVDAADEGKELALELLHDGKEVTVKVVPAPRPVDRVIINPTATPSGAAASQQEFLKHQHQALKALERSLLDRQAAGMMFVRPGIVTQKPIELPKDVSVNIAHRFGKKTITVERGDQKWEVTEDTLDELPEDLRGPVGAIVHGPARVTFGLRSPEGTVRVSPAEVEVQGDVRVDRVETAPTKVRVLRTDDKDDAKMDAVLKELKSLRKQLDEVQRTLKDRE